MVSADVALSDLFICSTAFAINLVSHENNSFVYMSVVAGVGSS